MSAGFGLGLRPPFYADAAAGTIPVDWFEVITENFMVAGGRPLEILDAVRRHYPIALHGVGLDLGGSEPLDDAYLRDLELLVRRARPLWVSDHLCWTRFEQIRLHDLLPLPYSEEVAVHVAARIRAVQDASATACSSRTCRATSSSPRRTCPRRSSSRRSPSVPTV